MIPLSWELTAIYLMTGMFVTAGAFDQPRVRLLHARARASMGPARAFVVYVIAFVLAVPTWPLRLPSVVRALLWPLPDDPSRPRPRPPWER